MYSHNEILYCIVVPPGPSRLSRIARSRGLKMFNNEKNTSGMVHQR